MDSKSDSPRGLPPVLRCRGFDGPSSLDRPLLGWYQDSAAGLYSVRCLVFECRASSPCPFSFSGTTGSPKSPPIWSSSRHGLTAVSLCVVIISVTGVVGSARRSRSWLCCYMVSTLVLIVSQIAFAAVLLGHLPNRVLRRRPVTGDTGIISSGERAEEEFWEQLFDAQVRVSCRVLCWSRAQFPRLAVGTFRRRRRRLSSSFFSSRSPRLLQKRRANPCPHLPKSICICMPRWCDCRSAQYISCYCAFIGAALMFINVILTFAFQLQEYPKVVAKMHSTRSSLIQTRC